MHELEAELGDEGGGGVPAKFSGGLLCILIFDQIVHFGEALKLSVNALFYFNKLHKTPTEILMLLTIFGSIEHFLMPIGGVIADVIRNKFVMLLFAYLVYLGNNALFTLLTIRYFSPWKWPIIYTTESITALDNAIIEPTGEAFLMDQFKYPEGTHVLRQYVHINRISAKALNIIAHFMSPVLKTRIPCLQEQDCYLIPYGLFLALYAFAQLIFYYGSKFYIIKEPEIEVVIKVAPCIMYGFAHYLRERRSNPQPHWMDHAKRKYGVQLVGQSKAFLRVQLMRIGLPLFIAVSHNFGLAAFIVRLRTRQRVAWYKIIPDHLNLLDPVFGLLVWIFMAKVGEHRIKKSKLDRPLRRIFFGLCLDVIVAILYGFLAWHILQNLPIKPGVNEAQLRIFNSANCSCIIETSKFFNNPLELVAQGTFTNKHISVHNYEPYHITITGSCFEPFSGNSYLQEGEAITVFIKASSGKAEISTYNEIISTSNERCLPRISVSGADILDKIVLIDRKFVEIDMRPAEKILGGVKGHSDGPRSVEVLPDWYTLYKNDRKILMFNTDLGGIYNVMITDDSATVSVIAEPNSVHFSWLIPIQIVQSFSEYFISIGTKEFDFPETPSGLRGISSALGQVFSGFGFLFIPLYMTPLRMDFEFYYYALMKLSLLAIFLICALRIRSRHQGRKLI